LEAGFSTLTAWSYGLTCVGFAALALQLRVRLRGDLREFALLVAVALSALWGLLGLALALSPQPMLFSAAAIADVLRIGGWFMFLGLAIVWPRATSAFSQMRSRLVTAAALIILGLVAQIFKAFNWSAFGDPGRLVFLDSLALAVFALVLIETLFRNLPAESRWNVKPLCIGLTVAFCFDVYVYADAVLFNRIDADAFSVRGLVHALVVPLVAVTAARGGNWTSRVTLSRRIVFHSAALIASGIYLLFVAAAGYYVRVSGGEWGRAFQVALLFAGLLGLSVLALSGSMRAKLRVLVSKHFFSYRYDYRDEWLRFTQTLSACDGQAALGQQIIRGLANMVESPSGALWLLDITGRQYVQSARWNMPANAAIEAADSELPQFLTQSGWVINLEEYRSLPARYGRFRLPAWLSEAPSAWLVVPLATGEELIGFVILGTPRARADLNWEVNDLLKTAGRQAASFLGHMQATEALLETRKFDAFNRMSAFVVHDLKNIVAQLSLMLKNAERHKDNPEFQQDMLMTVGHSVERMKHLMMQLREGTTPVNAPSAVDLGEIIRRIERSKTGHEPVPQMRVETRVVARAHEDRVERVIGHIVQNAIDATDKDGHIVVTLGRDGDKAVVEVRDTGHGMTEDFVREHLFKPFQTTKRSGMGIGAYESYQYVQELGGDIVVESKPGQGTTMRILLPLYEINTVADVARKAVA
jgi:putative PEP-CTERM system histidine kinase